MTTRRKFLTGGLALAATPLMPVPVNAGLSPAYISNLRAYREECVRVLMEKRSDRWIMHVVADFTSDPAH